MLVYATGPLAIFTAFGVWAYWKRKQDLDGRLVAAAFLAGWLGIIAAGRFFAHYYVMLFPLMALLVPTGLVYVRDGWKTRQSRMFVWSLIAISMIAPLGINGAIYFHADADQRHIQKYFGVERAQWEAQSQEYSDWLVARTEPGDKIYNLGFQNEVYFYTKLQAPTRFLFDYPFQLDHSFEQEALADLKADPPKYVFGSKLDQPPFIPNDTYYPYAIYNWVSENYDYVGQIYFAYTWRLKTDTYPAGTGLQGLN
jgi:4-amino-4-deoxy-L-arabinose transferase-like glycosyltransferase